MQADLFKCSFCSESYDLELHIPKFLISCPHCLCLRCLNVIFIHYAHQGLRCPSCKISFPSTIKTPNDFPTNPTLLQLLQSRVKAKLGGDCTETDHEGILDAKQTNEDEDSYQDNVRKKQKIDELVKLQESVKKKFIGMRNTLHAKQPVTFRNIEKNDDQNGNPQTEIANKLQGVFTETQDANRRRFLKSESVQKVRQFSQQNEEEHDRIPLKTNTFNIFKGHDYGNYHVFTPSMVSDETEGELSQSDQTNKPREKEIQEMKKQMMEIKTESQLKLDLSNKDASAEIFTTFCSEDLWDGVEKNQICRLEINLFASSLTDQQFINFVQNIMIQMENLTSISINLAKTKMTHRSMQILSQNLRNYNLKSFKLNCSQTSIRSRGIKSIDDGLSWSVKILENIEIVLDSTDLQGEKFLDVLMGMSQLKHLKLSFENSQISSALISSVVFGLHFLAKNLESLDLNFNGTDIDDESLESFSSHVVSQMERLKHFKLCLGKTLISDEFLLDFFHSLSSLANRLETLELDLHSLELHNTPFKLFCKEISSQMQNIQYLKLNQSAIKMVDGSKKNLILPVHKLPSLALNICENKIHSSGLTKVHPPPLREKSPVFFSNMQKEFKPKKKRTKFDVEKRVYAELKQELAFHDGRKQDPQKLDTGRVSRIIKNLEPKAYDSIIIKILKRVLCISEVEASKLEEWKKIIQTKIGTQLEINSQKPKKEYRKRQKKSKTENNIEISEDKITTERNQNHHNTDSTQNNTKIRRQKTSVRKQSCSNSRKKENTYNTRRKQNDQTISDSNDFIEVLNSNDQQGRYSLN